MKYWLISFVLITIIGLPSCSEDTKQVIKTGFKLYQSDSLGIEMQYPASFAPVPNLNQNVPIAFYEIRPDSINYLMLPNVLVNVQPIPPVNVSFNEYMQASRTQLTILMQNRYPDFTIYGVDSLNINNVPVGVFQYDTPKDDSTSFTSKMYIALQKNRAVQFNCTTPKADFARYEAVFAEIINTIKLKN